MSCELRDRDGYCFFIDFLAEELLTGTLCSSGAAYRLAEEEQRRGHMLESTELERGPPGRGHTPAVPDTDN